MSKKLYLLFLLALCLDVLAIEAISVDEPAQHSRCQIALHKLLAAGQSLPGENQLKADLYRATMEEKGLPESPDIVALAIEQRGPLGRYRQSTAATLAKATRLDHLQRELSIRPWEKIRQMERSDHTLVMSLNQWKTNDLQAYTLMRELFGRAFDHRIDLRDLYRRCEAQKAERQIVIVNWPESFNSLDDLHGLVVEDTKKYNVEGSYHYYDEAGRRLFPFREHHPLLYAELLGHALRRVFDELKAQGEDAWFFAVRDEINALQNDLDGDLRAHGEQWRGMREDIVANVRELTALRARAFEERGGLSEGENLLETLEGEIERYRSPLQVSIDAQKRESRDRNGMSKQNAMRSIILGLPEPITVKQFGNKYPWATRGQINKVVRELKSEGEIVLIEEPLTALAQVKEILLREPGLDVTAFHQKYPKFPKRVFYAAREKLKLARPLAIGHATVQNLER